MDVHLLRTFIAVADAGSFSAAAHRLGYTQSAVSQHIAALEADLGVVLFTRRPVALTETGVRLRDHASRLLVHLAAARADVTRVLTVPGRLRVGLTPLAWTAAVAAALARSGSRVEVVTASPSGVADGVATADLDAGLIDGFTAPSDPIDVADPGGTVVTTVSEVPAVIAVPAGHPLARRRSLVLTDLSAAFWIDAPAVASPPPDVRCGLTYTGADPAVLADLVAAGHGLARLPAPMTAAHPGLIGVPITEPRLVHRVEFRHRSAPGVGPAVDLAVELSLSPRPAASGARTA